MCTYSIIFNANYLDDISQKIYKITNYFLYSDYLQKQIKNLYWCSFALTVSIPVHTKNNDFSSNTGKFFVLLTFKISMSKTKTNFIINCIMILYCFTLIIRFSLIKGNISEVNPGVRHIKSAGRREIMSN